jgi:hypothetical protein
MRARSRSSPAPKICEWLAQICSTSVVPETEIADDEHRQLGRVAPAGRGSERRAGEDAHQDIVLGAKRVVVIADAGSQLSCPQQRAIVRCRGERLVAAPRIAS